MITGTFKGKVTRKVEIFAPMLIMEVPKDLSLQGEWVELL